MILSCVPWPVQDEYIDIPMGLGTLRYVCACHGPGKHDHVTTGNRRDRIDPSAQVYVWAQVAGDIRADITTGRLRPGAKLPTELELSETYGVARNTIRRAITELVSDGLVIVMRGRGTFVKHR